VHDRVALAPYEKRRRLDRRELTAHGLIAEELSTSAVHRQRACSDGVGRSHPEESGPNVPECDGERHGILAEAVALEDRRRRDEYEMVDQSGPGCCDACADGASQRVSDQSDTLNANSADQRAEIRRSIGEHETTSSRRAKPRKVDEMDLQVFCKRRHYRFPPAPRSSETVDEQRGRSRAARDAVTDRHAADLARSLLEHDIHPFLRRSPTVTKAYARRTQVSRPRATHAETRVATQEVIADPAVGAADARRDEGAPSPAACPSWHITGTPIGQPTRS
jgi:hypothetical protein